MQHVSCLASDLGFRAAWLSIVVEPGSSVIRDLRSDIHVKNEPQAAKPQLLSVYYRGLNN